MATRTLTCPVCQRAFDALRSRFVRVDDEGHVVQYCSGPCQELRVAPPPPPPARPSRRWLVAPAVVAGLGFAILWKAPLSAATQAALEMAHHPNIAGSLAGYLPPPEPPPLSELLTADYHESARWVHPLFGPERQLPLRSTRKFGAGRTGMRPDECGSGHCGVDLGEKRGDSVIAVHDGVVERVVTVVDEGTEGRYVRISHNRGQLVTSYMHLDQVRSDLKPGMQVKAGELVGSVGDTGTHHAGPHLHFAVSTRRGPGDPELYIDPEPLLHTWSVEDPPLPRAGRR